MKKRSNICVVGVQEGGIKEWEQYFKRPRVNIFQAETKRSTNFKKDNYKQTNRQITPSHTVLKNQRQRVILKSRFKKMHCPQRNNNKNASLFNTEDETQQKKMTSLKHQHKIAASLQLLMQCLANK